MRRFLDVDQMALALAGTKVELIQAGSGTGGWLLSVALDDAKVQLGRYDTKVLTRGVLDPTRVTVMVPLGTHTPSLWEGLPGEVLLVYAPGAQQFAYDGEGSLWARITVESGKLERAFVAATGRKLQFGESGFRAFQPAEPSLVRLKQRLRELPRSIRVAAASRKPFRREQEHQLLDELCRALASSGSASDRRTRRSDPRRIVRSVEEALLQKLQEPVRLADLTIAAGASERTVEYAFRRLLATTPMRYVKLIRLSRVHRRLIASQARTTTVTELAMDWGFEHLSQFAREYRDVYGEVPSTTLRRNESPHREKGSPIRGSSL